MLNGANHLGHVTMIGFLVPCSLHRKCDSTHAMADLIVRCAIVIAALSPIWRGLYIRRFWVRGRGTVIQVNVERVSGDGGGWIWVPTIEYYADGQRWEFPKSHFRPLLEYRVGDQFDILYHPSKPWRCTYGGRLHWIFGAAFTGAIGIYVAVRSPRVLISRSLATLLANYFASAS